MQRRLLAGSLWVGLIFIMTTNISRAQSTNGLPVHKVVLDNGLTLLVREDHSAPIVSAQAWVRAGSITEGRWMGAGLSHVLEHMLFKGTPTRGVAQIAQEIEDKGGSVNAYTSFEQTVYHINIPSESWRTAVDILADCMMNATIPEDELLKEKQVILREMAMNQDDPNRRADRMLWSTAYTTHPYRHPVIGYPDIYNRVTREDVVAYYKQHYVPNNMVFVAVGDIKIADVEAEVRKLTKDFKMSALEPAVILEEPPQVSTRERHEEMAMQLSRFDLAWHIPAITSPDVSALDVMAIILGQGKSSRLYRELRQNRGLVHAIEASSYTPAHPGLFTVEAMADPDKRDAAIAAVRVEMKKLATEPVTDTELRKAVKTSVSDHLDRLKTMEGQASDLAQNELTVGDPNFSATYLENLRKVRPEDIRRVAEKYLTDDNLTITSLNPIGTVTKAQAAVAAASEIQIKKFELSNGLQLIVREDPKLPLVDIHVVLKGGVLAETDANNGITKLMARMLLKGTKTRTADQIADTIENVGGDISYFAGNNSFGVTTHVLSEDMDLALEVVADVFQNPEFPDNMLVREKEVQLAEIKAEQDRILRVAQQLMRNELFERHPYRMNPLGTATTVPKLARSDLAEFHRRYVVPGNMILTVFGNVHADDVRKDVEAAFGKMKPAKLEFPATTAEHLAKSVRKEETQPKEQAVLLLGFSGTDLFNKDRFALDLLSEAYSGMGNRLFLRIRDELGLAYYVGAYQLVGLDPGYFVLYVGTTPQNVATCEKEFLAELEKLQKDGLSEEELTRAKNSLIGQRKVRMQDNAELSLMVALDELYGLGYDFFKTVDDKYRAVTMDDIKRVAERYFNNKPHAVAIVRPSAAKSVEN
jgi:zinc protease